VTWLRQQLAAPTLGNWRLDWGVGLLAGALGASVAWAALTRVLLPVSQVVLTALTGWLP
jgi:hypothetical protein